MLEAQESGKLTVDFSELVPQVDLNRSYEETFPLVGPVNVFEGCATLLNPYLEWSFQDILRREAEQEAVGITDFTADYPGL